nr:hypothetical protein [Tanacetum cinerariifolium]
EIESFSPSHIPNEDSDSFMEEIDLFLAQDDPMPPSIEDDDDSEWDILFLERLLHDDPIPFRTLLTSQMSSEFFFPSSPICIPGNMKTLAKGLHPPSLNFLSFNWESCSQPMLKSSYKAEASVIISIPPLVGGVADVVVEIKDTDDLL